MRLTEKIEEEFDPESIMGNFSSKHKKKRFIHTDSDHEEEDNNSISFLDVSSKDGLNFTQRRAARLIGVCGYTDEETAAELNVTVSRVKKWKKKQEFANLLYAFEKQISIDAIEKRKKLNNEITGRIHDTIFGKIEKGDLDKYSVQQLVDLLSKISSESRLDDKNTVPKKIIEQHEGSISFNDIQNRWNESRNRDLMNQKLSEDIEQHRTIEVLKKSRKNQ